MHIPQSPTSGLSLFCTQSLEKDSRDSRVVTVSTVDSIYIYLYRYKVSARIPPPCRHRRFFRNRRKLAYFVAHSVVRIPVEYCVHH